MERRESGTPAGAEPAGRLGSFDVDQGGRLSPGLPASTLAMEFRWRERPVTTSLRAEGDAPSGTMVFRTRIGRMPSSATAAAARPDAFELLRCLPALLPPRWTLMLGADHSLQIEAELSVAMPAMASDLLVPAVRFCLAASPLLDLLEENAMGMRA